jgi:hypothetical protein
MGKVPVTSLGPYMPIHQFYPSPLPFIPNINATIVNYETGSEERVYTAYNPTDAIKDSVLSDLLLLKIFRDAYPESWDETEPLSLFFQPVFRDFEGSTIVAFVESIFQWRFLFTDILDEEQSVMCFVESTCGANFSIRVDEHDSTFIGFGDAHDKQFDENGITATLGFSHHNDDTASTSACIYTLTVYPTIEYREQYNEKAALYAVVLGIAFATMVAAFFAYD